MIKQNMERATNSAQDSYQQNEDFDNRNYQRNMTSMDNRYQYQPWKMPPKENDYQLQEARVQSPYLPRYDEGASGSAHALERPKQDDLQQEQLHDDQQQDYIKIENSYPGIHVKNDNLKFPVA